LAEVVGDLVEVAAVRAAVPAQAVPVVPALADNKRPIPA
jgi:hypothetical protein